MYKLPRHVERYLRKSTYCFTELEIARMARRLANIGYPGHVDEAVVEFQLLGYRAAIERTPRNTAIYHNAICIYAKAKGPRGSCPICPCGSFYMHYDVDGPDPML